MLINKLTLSGRGCHSLRMVGGGAIRNNSPPPPENKGRSGLGTHFGIHEVKILKNGAHIQANPATPHYQSRIAHSPKKKIFCAPVVTKFPSYLIQTLLEPFQSE